MSQIKKAIIPAAGLGTRFLPATKSLPKEMLPIIDIPTIQLIVEEAVKSGIEEILIITNQYKHVMENHFDTHYELEHRLISSGKTKMAEQVRAISSLAKIHYIRQLEPRGLGHAVLCAKTFVKDEPFAILLGDDVVVTQEGELPATAQLIKAYEKTNSSILGVQNVPENDVDKYGIVDYNGQDGRFYKMVGMVEKPDVGKHPSTLAALGRYVLSPEIFEILENIPVGKNNEIQLTDAIEVLMQKENVYAYDFIGTRYDVGDRFGFIKATIDFALTREDLKEEVKLYIKDLAKKI